MREYTRGQVVAPNQTEPKVRLSFWQFLSNKRYLRLLLGTAGTWFVFDYAYYGNSISTLLIIKAVAPAATTLETMAWSLIIFSVAAVPGYLLALLRLDEIGHKRLQWIGCTMMGLAFLALGVVPGITGMLVPFLLIYGVSYFFAEFGPNTTTFVLSAELYPVNMRTTGHGLSAGVAKVGAFIGVFVFPILSAALGVAGTLRVTFVFAMVGVLLTMLLPEPAKQDLEIVSHEQELVAREA